MDIRELALSWYQVMSALSSAVAGPLMVLSTGTGLPVFSAVLLGLLGATSPCQLTTNAGALAILSRWQGSARGPLAATAAYLGGKALVYTAAGTAVLLAGRGLAANAIPVAVAARQVLGPSMVLTALFLFGVLRPPIALGGRLSQWIEDRAGGPRLRGGFLLGIAFGFAFCPTLFWLFFGLTMPLALASPIGIVLPPAFALGTGLPLMAAVALIAGGAPRTSGYQARHSWAVRAPRLAAAMVLLLAGLNDTVVYWLL